jgi:beta-galactosidase
LPYIGEAWYRNKISVPNFDKNKKVILLFEGDATSLEQFHLPAMKLFSGKLVVLVQSTEEAGKIKLSVTGKGLKSSKIILNSNKI